jgi:hypothetical protein
MISCTAPCLCSTKRRANRSGRSRSARCHKAQPRVSSYLYSHNLSVRDGWMTDGNRHVAELRSERLKFDGYRGFARGPSSDPISCFMLAWGQRPKSSQRANRVPSTPMTGRKIATQLLFSLGQ